MRKIVVFFALSALLFSCCGKGKGYKAATQWGDSIAIIDDKTYYWQQLADESARISVVKDNKLVTECTVRGLVYGAKQYDDGDIYILCGQNQISWFDIRNIPSEIDLMTEAEWENYDPSQENADAIIDIGM